MSPGVTLAQCISCGASHYPRRLLCASCGGARFRSVVVHTARVEEATTLRRPVDGDSPPRRLATVRTLDGVPLVVRLLDDSGPSSVVQLTVVDGAVLARAAQ